jgi:putative hemolysin
MRLSYAPAAESRLHRGLIHVVEATTGAGRIQRLYRRLSAEMGDDVDVWSAVLRLLKIQVETSGLPIEDIPAEGPLLVVANHPFGVLDGAVACHLLAQRRRDFRLLALNILSAFPEMAPWVLPIDFSETPEAMQTNLASRATALSTLQAGGAVVVFPAGEVATAPKVFGAAVESPWRLFIGRLVKASDACVLPMHFSGKNTWLFHAASRLGPSARLAMFLRETNRRAGSRVQVTVGTPIANQTLRAIDDRRQIVDFLRAATFALAGQG